MRKHLTMKKRISRIRNPIRGALHLALPTSLRFLQANPTPESFMRKGRKRFMKKWQPRRRCGQWRPEKFSQIDDLARRSIGVRDLQRIDEFEIKTMANDLIASRIFRAFECGGNMVQATAFFSFHFLEQFHFQIAAGSPADTGNAFATTCAAGGTGREIPPTPF